MSEIEKIINKLKEELSKEQEKLSLDDIEMMNKPYSKKIMGKVVKTSPEEKIRKRFDFRDSTLVQYVLRENLKNSIEKVSADELSFIYAYKKHSLDNSIKVEKILSEYMFNRNINSVVEIPTVEKINGYMEKYAKFDFIEKDDFFNKFITELNRKYE